MSIIRVVAVLLAVSAVGCKKDKGAESGDSSEGGEADLNPEEKKTIMGGLIAKEMCKPEGYFASCATFEAGECEALTVASFRACADENPEALEKLDEASSQALGVCTGKSALLKVAGEGKLSIEGPCANPEQFP